MKLIVTPTCLHFGPFVRHALLGVILRLCTTGGWKSPGAAPTRTGLVPVLKLPAASVSTPGARIEMPPASPGFHGCEEVRYTREPSGATAPCAIARGVPAIWRLKSLRLSDPPASGSLGTTITSLVLKANAALRVGEVMSLGTVAVAE